MSSAKFIKRVICMNAVIPILMLGWDYWNQQLGPNAINTAIHITGIVSLVLLLLSLLISPLVRITKQQDLFSSRKTLGLFGFAYAMMHLALYFFLDREGDLSSTLNEISSRRFLQIGTLAVILLLPLAATSTQSMRKRLGIRNWNRLHRLAYLIAALAVLHYFLQVKSDTRTPIVFAIVLGVLLVLRIPTQALVKSEKKISLGITKRKQNKTWKGNLRLTSIQQETHNVSTFRFSPLDSNLIPFKFQAGQFISLQLMIGSQMTRRSYTIASSPSQHESIEITVKREPRGAASSYLHEKAKIGDLFAVQGPYGRFTLNEANIKQILLIAGGVGITPIMSILRYLRDIQWDGEAQVLISAKTKRDLLFFHELDSMLESGLRVRVQTTLTKEESESTSSQSGRINESMFKPFLHEHPDSHVYLCGPNDMAESINSMLEKIRIPPDKIHRESFGGSKRSDFNEPAKEVNQFVIAFETSKCELTDKDKTPILELAESCGVSINFDCREGVCGQCKVQLSEGTVEMGCEDGLSPSEKSEGIVLACQAVAKSDLVIKV